MCLKNTLQLFVAILNSQLRINACKMKKKVLPSETRWPLLGSEEQQKLRDRMEEIIHSPATSVDEQVSHPSPPRHKLIIG